MCLLGKAFYDIKMLDGLFRKAVKQFHLLVSTSDLKPLQGLLKCCKMALDLSVEGVDINNPSLTTPLNVLQHEGPDINNQALMCLHFLLNGGRLNKRHRGLIGGPVPSDGS